MSQRFLAQRLKLSALQLEDRVTPAVAFALAGSNLFGFDTGSPSITTTIPITGVSVDDTLVGIDFRPQNGQLYGLGVNAPANTATLYAISVRTGVATAVGTPGSIAFVDGSGTAVDLPDPATVGYGIDFNPAQDRLRVVAGSLNFRVSPNTGAGIDGNIGGADGSVAGINPDGPINSATTSVDATAYTNNFPNVTITTQYTLDAGSNSLFIQNPPNAGTQSNTVPITLSGNPLDFSSVNGFDIPTGVNTSAGGTPVTSGSAFAVLNVGGTTSLYGIDLVTGAATFVGNIGTGTTPVQGFAVHSELGAFPAVALNSDGTTLLRFNTATPGIVTTQAVSGVTAGETLVGIDFRPQTGQLYGLGVNAAANTGTLYLIDPQNGGSSVVGAASQIAFVDASGNAVDFPDPATIGYGFDFNPTVDRIRVTTGSGLNFRLNPITGAAVDGNLNASPSPAGTNPDGNATGLPMGSTGVSSTAYTNSFGQSLSGGVTTQYTLDAASNTLFIQNPPNSGTQTFQRPISLAGVPLDFSEVGGFDIPAGLRVTTSGEFVSFGFGYATLTVGATTSLYRIDLLTGVAINFGAIGTGSSSTSGLALGDQPVGAVSFRSATQSQSEAFSNLIIELVRTGGTSGTATVVVTATAGTATSEDFVVGSFTATFAEGAFSTTAVFTILNDSVIESDEIFTLTLSDPTFGLLLGSVFTSTVTITDNDVAPPVVLPGSPPAGAALATASGTTLTATNPDGSTRFALNPYPGFAGGFTVARGDVNADGVLDIITGTGPGGGPHVKVFDGITGSELRSFFAYDIAVQGGVNVATGDINGDGVDDIITGVGAGGGPNVKVFDGATGQLLQSFFAYDSGYRGGVNVAVGDIDGDGENDIVTGTGRGGAAHVKVFRGRDQSLLASFFAYDPAFLGGVNVAVGDLNGDGADDIVTATGPGAGPHVKAFSGRDGNLISSFFAFAPAFTGGARVAVTDADGDGLNDIVIGAGPGGGPNVKVFDPNGLLKRSSFVGDPNFLGGVFVG